MDRKGEIKEGIEKLRKRVEGSEKLKLSWCRTCTDVSLQQFIEGEREEDEIYVEEWCSL